MSAELGEDVCETIGINVGGVVGAKTGVSVGNTVVESVGCVVVTSKGVGDGLLSAGGEVPSVVGERVTRVSVSLSVIAEMLARVTEPVTIGSTPSCGLMLI